MENITKNNVRFLQTREINDFATENNITLPLNFIALYLKYNGGLLLDNSDVKKFLSIKYGKFNIEDIINIHQKIENNIPKNYLPFASDWSDNPITICLKEGSDYGKIVTFYFDSDEEPETIANSLEELLGVNSIDEL
jgi:SMI1 / KNR4 family (SUKH-1)